MTDIKSFNSNDVIDQVIYTSQTTINSGSSTTFDTGLGQYAFPIGIFSTDGGSTWRDCESSVNLISSRGVDRAASLKCSSAGVVRVDVTNYGGASVVLTIIKFALLAIDSPSDITYAVGGTLPTSFSNKSNGAYRQIVQRGSISGIADAAAHTVALSPSGLPLGQYWGSGYAGNTDYTLLPGFIRIAGGAINGFVGVYADSSNLYFSGSIGGFTNAYYRVYKET